MMKLTEDYVKSNFHKFVDKTDGGCWMFRNSDGRWNYGRIKISGRRQNASRWSVEFFIRPLNRGECALHKCDNPGCVNPEHLFIGTRKDNIRDMISKGRMRTVAGDYDPGYCHRGHPRTEENTYKNPSGSRVCRECMRVYDRNRGESEGTNHRGHRSDGKLLSRTAARKGIRGPRPNP